MSEEMTKTPETNEIATTAKDIDIFAGWLKRLENPDPVLSTESRGKGIKLYDEAARDAHVASVLQTRILAVVGKEWNIEAGKKVKGANGETKSEEISEFVRDTLLACNFDQARQEILKGILYGFYCAEVMWVYRGQGENGQKGKGEIRIEKIFAKHPRRFVFTPERGIRLLTPAAMIDGEAVPERKFIVFTYGSSDNPYGDGLGQKVWWPVWFKKNGIKFWVLFAEKFGSPTAVGKYPAGTSKADQDKLHEAIEAIQQETGITIPEGMLIEYLEAARTSSVDTYETLCNYMDSQISKAILGHTAAADATPGKLGSEQQSVDIREDIVKADADALCECLNNGLIRWIVDYNFGPQEEYPKIWIRTDPEKDLKVLSERDRTLVKDIGVPVGRKYFYDTYNLPEPEMGEELIAPPLAPEPFPAFAEKKTPRNSTRG